VLLSIADEPVPAVFRGPPGTIGVAAAFLLGTAAAAGRPATAQPEPPYQCPGEPRSCAGRPATAQLVVAPCADDADVDPLHALAGAADAWSGEQPATIALGRIQPGTMLELRLLPQGARA
jgi:hypothetical protein